MQRKKGVLTCECGDPGCPAHEGKNKCSHVAQVKVRRIDMDCGKTTFWMCETCAEDALESGVFDMEDTANA
jgi:hypothetical protein